MAIIYPVISWLTVIYSSSYTYYLFAAAPALVQPFSFPTQLLLRSTTTATTATTSGTTAATTTMTTLNDQPPAKVARYISQSRQEQEDKGTAAAAAAAAAAPALSSNQIVVIDEDNENNEMEEPTKENIITFVEFYCGVGGWSMALERALQNQISNPTGTGNTTSSMVDDSSTSSPLVPKLQCLAALDHSDLCTKVYRHNHHHHHDHNHPKSNIHQDNNNKSTKMTVKKNDPTCTTSIDKLSLQQVEQWNADIWAMSPPCQPHTRQRKDDTNDNNNDSKSKNNKSKKDVNDPRSSSFQHLLTLLQQMSDHKLPSLILVENVVGFETSISCQQMRCVFRNRGYHVGHFHLTPTQVGLPNDRPRYYCVAVNKRCTNTNQQPQQQEQPQPLPPPPPQQPPVSFQNDSSILLWNKYLHLETINTEQLKQEVVEPQYQLHTSLEELGVRPCTAAPAPASGAGGCIMKIADIVNSKNNANLQLRIPSKILSSPTAWCFDIVTDQDARSSCFTQAYGKFVRGTGSVYYFGQEENERVPPSSSSPPTAATTSSPDSNDNDDDNDKNNDNNNLPLADSSNAIPSSTSTTSVLFPLISPEQRQYDPNWSKGLDLQTSLRYFSGLELARLMDYSPTFTFPSDVTLKQQWKLVGNSLNVRVASKLCELGLVVIILSQQKNKKK